MDWGQLRTGLNVDIQRTDGRVHQAIISGLNFETKSVTVEWFEKGETKGKEIDLESIFILNSDLASKTNDAPVTRSSVNSQASIQTAAQTNAINNNKGSLRARQSYAHVRVGTQNGHVAPADTNGDVIAPTPTPTAASMTSSTINKLIQQDTIGNARGRRSNVVKEVEKLKKNREERRERQAQEKAQKQEMMNVDPGNPNWEFAAKIREYRNQLEYNPLKDGDFASSDEHQICVCVRKRPLNKKELTRKEIDVLTVPSKELVVVHEPRVKLDLAKALENHTFRFDYTFDESTTNNLVYKFTAQPLVKTIFEGGMATCFAYGQTGSGKTHTMGGDFHGKSQEVATGIYALTAMDVFKLLKSPKYKQEDLVVSASFFEIYSGKVFDLLNNKTKLRVLEDGKQQVQVVGLREQLVESADDVLKLIGNGNSVRTSGQTSANQHSSRSHAVFQVILRKRSSGKLHGKFSLIDLAGNERGADTSSANRQTRMEGAEINKSLLALKECIRALGRKGTHLPFRASKLTQVLRDSFVGENSKTCMIAMISPGNNSCEHSLNTLRYADRVKELGVNDPEMKSSPVDSGGENSNEEMDVAYSSPQRNDLQQLRSLAHEGELSADMFTLHEAVSHLQDMEEELLDLHKSVIDEQQRWSDRDLAILGVTNEVDYDVDVYVQTLEDLLTEKLDVLSKFKEKVSAYRHELAEEEKISRNIKMPFSLK